MARGQSGGSSDTAEAPANAGAESSGSDSRFSMVTVPDGHAVTQLSDGALTAGQQKRVDVIRALARTGNYTRGEIKKMINDLGDPIAYQIVFQATRGIPNVKKAQKAPAEGGETAAAESETESAE